MAALLSAPRLACGDRTPSLALHRPTRAFKAACSPAALCGQHRRSAGRRRSAALPPTRASAWSDVETGSALGRLKSEEVLGVVIVDAGRRTPEGDELLLDFAACYGRVFKREIVAVACAATIETAVRDCSNAGADKVMVVPYVLCRSRETAADDLPLLLADVQLQLPGVRCVIGETLSVESLLAEYIENQVKVVEVKKAPANPERWWQPEPRRPKSAPEEPAAAASGSATLPPAEPQAWQGSISSSSGSSSGERATGASTQQDTRAEPAGQTLRWSSGDGVDDWGRASSGAPSSSKATVAWTDDFSATLDGDVLVVDYRQRQGGGASGGGSSFSSSFSSGDGGDEQYSYAGGSSSSSGGAAAPKGPAYWYSSAIEPEPEPVPASEPAAASWGGDAGDWSAGGPAFSADAAASGYAAEEAGSSWSSVAVEAASVYDARFPAGPGAPAAAAAPAAAGAEPEAELLQPLEQRLQHMEEQLQHITELLHVAVAPASLEGTDGEGSFSTEQLEFLAREQRRRGRRN